MPALTRAGIAHLYFESVHPFEDGNGRIGRALAEKALAQNLAQPSLIALAYTIARAQKAYYTALERNNKDNQVTDWLVYFSETVIVAQRNTIKRVEFYVEKTKLYDRLRGQLNPRQEKAVARMFREGFDGFKGGLSAENYISITQASRATATRDLQDFVANGALTRTGELRHTAINSGARPVGCAKRREAARAHVPRQGFRGHPSRRRAFRAAPQDEVEHAAPVTGSGWAAAPSDLILRASRKRRVSKDGRFRRLDAEPLER